MKDDLEIGVRFPSANVHVEACRNIPYGRIPAGILTAGWRQADTVCLPAGQA